MTPHEQSAWSAARRAYELGRARAGAVRGAVVAAGVAVLTIAVSGVHAAPWLPLTWALWLLVDWRGGSLRAGALRGLVAGAVTVVMPATWLHACCATMTSGGECSASGVCVAIGALIAGLAVVALPRATSTRTAVQGVLGVAAGMVAVSAGRCTSLLGGEALGLAAGVAMGLVAASAARAWLANRPLHQT